MFKSSPTIIVEVLSPSTAAIDRREKLIAYQSISTLQEYALVYQDRQQVELYRRVSNDEWEFSVFDIDDVLVLESFPNKELRIPFAKIYEGYNPPHLVKEEDSLYEPSWS